MISKMVFDRRLRWVVEAAPTVSPHNRISNVMHRTARGKLAPEGAPERGDAGDLLRALGDGAITDLSNKTKDDLQNIYRLCYPPPARVSASDFWSRQRTRPCVQRFPPLELLIQCLTRPWESAGIGDRERCSRIFIGKPSGLTTGVEGLFGTDGVLYALVFQVARESAADGVDIISHRQSSTTMPADHGYPMHDCTHCREASPRSTPGGGALPRNAELQVCLKELQHVGARAYEFPDLNEVRVPPMEFPSPTTTASASDAHPAQSVPTVYAAYAVGQPMPGVQPHLDFRALLQRACDVVERNREVHATEGNASGVDWSSSAKRIADLAESTLKSLHKQGWHAMTLFEVVLMYMLWFQAAAHAAPEDEEQGPAPRPAPRPAPGPAPGPATGDGVGSRTCWGRRRRPTTARDSRLVEIRVFPDFRVPHGSSEGSDRIH
ncbi:unnamed protein product [Ectocarpus sp. CCAP 1310/34]|nr:unnamed protein product [Ectocarpus sp. CCAP 1310/34]